MHAALGQRMHLRRAPGCAQQRSSWSCLPAPAQAGTDAHFPSPRRSLQRSQTRLLHISLSTARCSRVRPMHTILQDHKHSISAQETKSEAALYPHTGCLQLIKAAQYGIGLMTCCICAEVSCGINCIRKKYQRKRGGGALLQLLQCRRY